MMPIIRLIYFKYILLRLLCVYIIKQNETELIEKPEYSELFLIHFDTYYRYHLKFINQLKNDFLTIRVIKKKRQSNTGV